MKYYKVCLCILILSFSLIGCGSKPLRNVVETTTTTTIGDTQSIGDFKSDLTDVSKLTLKYNAGTNNTEVMGTATNNSKSECNFTIDIFYLNANGTPLTEETIQICDIKSGEKKLFSDMVFDMDVSRVKYTIQFGGFFTYTK